MKDKKGSPAAPTMVKQYGGEFENFCYTADQDPTQMLKHLNLGSPMQKNKNIDKCNRTAMNDMTQNKVRMSKEDNNTNLESRTKKKMYTGQHNNMIGTATTKGTRLGAKKTKT